MTSTGSLRRTVLKAVVVVAAAAAGCYVPPTPRGEDTRPVAPPNILLILADDHACSAVSSYGGLVARIAETPNIDRIAAEGARLERCFATNAADAPGRATILTGQYSHANGVYTPADGLDPALSHVAKHLAAAGWQTAVIGAWFLKTDPSGFDDWNILSGEGPYNDPVLTRKDAGSTTYTGRHATDVITDLSVDWIKARDPSRPFFLLCQYKAPHRSWHPARRFAEAFKDMQLPEPDTLHDDHANRSRAAAQARQKIDTDLTESDLKAAIPPNLTDRQRRSWAYQRFVKDYLRCVASIDENVGRLLRTLDAQGLYRDTVVIYTSDQGYFLGEHGYFGKRFMYEESIRVPLVIRYPREIAAGTVSADLAVNADIAPTILDLAQLPPERAMHGRSFRPNLQGRTPADWRASLYYRYWAHMMACGVPAHYGVRTDRYKLIFYYGLGLGKSPAAATEPEWELFDLEKDPRELKNVYADPSYQEIAAALKAELLRLKAELGDRDEDYPPLMRVRERYWQ
jgi:arylsulfatase A-like enzyme